MAAADQKRAESKADLDDTSATLAADREFLAKLKEHCALMDKEMEARSKTRDEEIGKNERTTEMTDRKKEGQYAHITDLENTIETLTKEIDGQKANIAEMQVQMKRAGEDRELENKAFQL